MNRTAVLAIIIGSVFILLVSMFAKGLGGNSQELELKVKGEKIIDFTLPDLLSDKMVTTADLISKNKGKPYFLINFWGSWCPACYQEHSFLLDLSKTETIYGINWKDTTEGATKFLKEQKNPFEKIIVDQRSLLAIGMGVYGAPETFLINSDLTILFRYAGPLDKNIWQSKFMPIIELL